MKAENRVKLHCRKQIKGRIYDSFTVVVSAGSADSAKTSMNVRAIQFLDCRKEQL